MTTATVAGITPTTKGSDASGVTAIDIVKLSFEGRAYYWESERGKYTLGQQVEVTPPSSPGANIQPR